MTHHYLTFFTSLLVLFLTLTDTKTLAQTATPFYYDRFDTNAFQLVGQTTTSRDHIRLTPAQGSKKVLFEFNQTSCKQTIHGA